MIHAATPGHRRRIWLWVAVPTAFVLLALAGIGWVAWQVIDNIGAPGPAPTGSGPCGASDAVNIQLVFVDGHTVQACTHDRPSCPNGTITGTGNGQTFSVSRFGLDNQLRSSSRRYVLSVSFNAPLPPEAADRWQLQRRAHTPRSPGPDLNGCGACASHGHLRLQPLARIPTHASCMVRRGRG